MIVDVERSVLIYEESLALHGDFMRLAAESACAPRADRPAMLARLETMQEQYLRLMRMHADLFRGQ